MVDPELQRVLNGDDAVGGGQQFDQGIEQGGLARSGTARHENVLLSQQRLARCGENLRGQGTEAHQVVGRKAPLAEAPYGDGHPWAGRGHTDRHA